jgi:hypothetical protein
MKPGPRLVILLLMLGAAAPLRADAASIVEKARAYYGGEAALAAIQSVHYQGVLTSTEHRPDGAEATAEAEVEIIVQKPFQQRIMARGPDKVEITGLDDYEGWQRIEHPKDGDVWRMTLLNKDQIKRLRANTWEQLAFYRGIEAKGGSIVDRGLVQLDTGPAYKLSFVHEEGIVFHRYFDPETGQLLLTETDQGARIREEGEIQTGGVRFPQRIVTRTVLPGGGYREVRVEFHSIQVNGAFAADHFRVPFMGARLAQ